MSQLRIEENLLFQNTYLFYGLTYETGKNTSKTCRQHDKIFERRVIKSLFFRNQRCKCWNCHFLIVPSEDIQVREIVRYTGMLKENVRSEG